MALLPIVIAPDPRLRVKCVPVTTVDGALRRLADTMLETMHAAPGIGLAAPQVADTHRLIVVDVARAEEKPDPLRLANPEIVRRSPELLLAEEGCLSLPDQYAEVERAAAVAVRYMDMDGAMQEISAEGLLAACLQHEIDHLDGVLFVDHLTALRRNIILRRMKKLKRQGEVA